MNNQSKVISRLRVTSIAVFMVLFSMISSLFAQEKSSMELANDAYNAGKFKLAGALYRKAVKEGESPALCYYNAANAAFQLNNLPQAIVYYRACAQNAPTFTKAHLNLAICYYTVNDLGKSIASVRRALDLEPTNQKALLLHATALRQCGATSKAIAVYETIARIFPTLEESYIALGEMYRDLGDEEMALRWLMDYPDNGKNMVYVYSLIANVYERKGDYSHVVYYLNEAFELDPSKRWVLFQIATIQNNSGNSLVALETCREGLLQFPDFGELAVLGGTIAFERERIADAEFFFTRGEKLGNASAIVGLTNVRNWRKAHLGKSS